MTTKLLGLLRLFRFELPLTAGVCVIFGELLASTALPSLRSALLGFASVFCLSAAALILNDYFDLAIDRINAPQRPLPAGLVTSGEVVALFAAVSLLGMLFSYAIGLTALLVGLVVWAVGLLYNWRFKRTGLPGNLMVCFSVGMTFVFGGIAVGQPWSGLVWLFAVLVMLIDLGEEIAADALDLVGDRQAGSRSIAVTMGRQAALNLSAAIFVLVILVSGLPFLFGRLPLVYLGPMLLMDACIVFATIMLLSPRTANPRAAIRAIYLSGLATIVICIAIRLFLAWQQARS